MPRIFAVKLNPYRDRYGIWKCDHHMPITTSFRNDLADAVNEDHPSAICQDNTCDITHALDNGYVYIAAALLTGATEVPHIDVVKRAHMFNHTLDIDPRVSMYNGPEWDDWINFFEEHTVECPGCGACCWDDNSDGSHATSCDNCLLEFEDKEEDD